MITLFKALTEVASSEDGPGRVGLKKNIYDESLCKEPEVESELVGSSREVAGLVANPALL